MSGPPRVLVLTGYGLNCDHETAHAFELAGAQSVRVHINDLISDAVDLADFHILAFVGGFSWGDDHGAGVIQAVRLAHNMGGRLLSFIHDGGLVIGICNGFQAVVNLGLLPGLDGDYADRKVALATNDTGNFRDDWVHLAANPASPCVFTRGLDLMELPVRHGEGKFVTDEATLSRMEKDGLVALRYARGDGAPAGGAFPVNPNGSMGDVAGICDPTGRVFGLMPHPEAYNHPTNHPDWTRRRNLARRRGEPWDEGLTVGVRLLKNGVDHVRENA
ncbi:MAG: phosphoribosylformylglycinamidine synthase subunit PurQ [Desulfatibacillaceae bacterium]